MGLFRKPQDLRDRCGVAVTARGAEQLGKQRGGGFRRLLLGKPLGDGYKLLHPVFLLDMKPPALREAVAVNLRYRVADGCGKFLHVDRFFDVVNHVQADGAAQIGNIRITADKNRFTFNVLAADFLGQLDAVQLGHANVGQQNIRLKIAGDVKRF